MCYMNQNQIRDLIENLLMRIMNLLDAGSLSAQRLLDEASKDYDSSDIFWMLFNLEKMDMIQRNIKSYENLGDSTLFSQINYFN